MSDMFFSTDVLEMHDTVKDVMSTSTNEIVSDLTKSVPGIDVNRRCAMLKRALSGSRLKNRMHDACVQDIDSIETLKDLVSSDVIYTENSGKVIKNYMNIMCKPVTKNGHRALHKKRTGLTRCYVDSLNLLLNMSKHYKRFLKCNSHSTGATDRRLQGAYTCDECGNKDTFHRDVDSVTCAKCGQELCQLIETLTANSARHASSNSVYNRTMHFRDCLYQYQGMHTPIMNSDVYTSLVKAMRECNVMGNTGNIKEDGKNVTKGVVLYYLRLLNYTRHYDDAVYIHHALTGQEPDNVQHLEAKLIHDFSLLSKKYDEMYAGKKDRRSFINMQIVLFQLLRRHGHPCELKDFASIKSLEQRARRDELYKELFTSLQWDYVDI